MGLAIENIPKKLAVPAVVVISLLFTGWIDPYRDHVSEGNSEFHQKKYHNARREYDRAEEYAPGEEDKKDLSFNMGDADYMLGDSDAAIAGFQRALRSGNKDTQKKAFFNLGNTHLRQKNYQEAIAAYINALKIDPGYEKAKKNLEYLLENMQDKDNREGDDKSQDSNQKNGKNQNSRTDRNQNKQGDQNRQQKQQPNQQQNQSAEGKISKDQIRNILESMKQKPVRRQKGSSERRRLEKYW